MKGALHHGNQEQHAPLSKIRRRVGTLPGQQFGLVDGGALGVVEHESVVGGVPQGNRVHGVRLDVLGVEHVTAILPYRQRETA